MSRIPRRSAGATLLAAGIVMLGCPLPALATGDGTPGGAVQAFDPRSGGASPKVSGPLTRADVPYSYRPGCPVTPAQLRRITISYFDFAGRSQRGKIIARSDAANDLVYVFSKAYAAEFPIAQMTPVDAFYDKGAVSPTQSDVRAMAADNTSAFNCRPVTGDPYRLSTHSVGIAIDINPAENPYVKSGRVYPAGSTTFLKRGSYRKGMILKSGALAKAMAAKGWPWGQRWGNPDYQHFSSNGG